MSEKSQFISKLINSKNSRAAYLRASISVNLSSQIRALRRRQPMTQLELAQAADMKQPRICAMEKPGATKFNLETLIRLAAAFKVGLIVRFASFGEVLDWENGYSQDSFDVTSIDEDVQFVGAPAIAATANHEQVVVNQEIQGEAQPQLFEEDKRSAEEKIIQEEISRRFASSQRGKELQEQLREMASRIDFRWQESTTSQFHSAQEKAQSVIRQSVSLPELGGNDQILAVSGVLQ